MGTGANDPRLAEAKLPPEVQALVNQLTLESRVRELERAQVKQEGEIAGLRHDVSSIKTDITSLNHYLSGDPNRKEDNGKLGEIVAAIRDVAAVRSDDTRRRWEVRVLVMAQLLAVSAYAIEWVATHH